MAYNLRSSNSKGRLALDIISYSSSSPLTAKQPPTLPSQSPPSTPPPPPPPPPGLTLKSPLGFHRSSSLCSVLSPDLNLAYDQVFTALPQTPHFCPLAKLSKNIREGIKNGYDIAFLKLVTKFHSFVDPSTFLSEVEDLTQEFEEFEEVGYDLTKIKERFNKLKRRAEQEEELKDEVEKLEEEKKERRGEIERKEFYLMELAAESARVEKEVVREKSEVEWVDHKKRKIMDNSYTNAKRFRNIANIPW